MTDLGNQRDVEKRNKAAKAAAAPVDEAVRWLMGDERGRAFVWDQLGRAGVFRSSMGATPELTAFNEGKRITGLALLDDVMLRLTAKMVRRRVQRPGQIVGMHQLLPQQYSMQLNISLYQQE